MSPPGVSHPGAAVCPTTWCEDGSHDRPCTDRPPPPRDPVRGRHADPPSRPVRLLRGCSRCRSPTGPGAQIAAMRSGVAVTAGSGSEPSAARDVVLAAFARALRRETHVLQDRPDLLWQQLYNRLQWERDPVRGVLEPLLERRSARGAAPWLRTRTPLRESEALRLTLAGHTGPANACAISPDGSFVVTASRDRICKSWDTATGKERASFSATRSRSTPARSAQMARSSSRPAMTTPAGSGTRRRAGSASPSPATPGRSTPARSAQMARSSSRRAMTTPAGSGTQRRAGSGRPSRPHRSGQMPARSAPMAPSSSRPGMQ